MPVIAVDGPAASGKGTIARALAARFGLPHLDTGMLYRAVAHAALAEGVALEDHARLGAIARRIDPFHLSHAGLRTAETAEAASRVSALPDVRAALLCFQQDFARKPGGAVLDGRDIGTVIAPDASAKLFVTADPGIRARRRYLELAADGRDVTEERILADILARDRRDQNRREAPLVMADDADLLDTSDLGIAAAVQLAVELVSRRLERTV